MNRGVLVAGVAVAVAATIGGVAWYVSTSDGGAPVVAATTLTTAVIEQRDVVTYDETTATLGYTDSVTVTSPAAGTVTSIASAGDRLVAGGIVATVDGSPVVAMIGDVPGWRDLSTSSSDGIDVRQLETNLVVLGYDPDGEIVIDEQYDAATKAAVNLWKTALGLDDDGKVAQGLVTFVPGELQVDSRVGCRRRRHQRRRGAARRSDDRTHRADRGTGGRRDRFDHCARYRRHHGHCLVPQRRIACRGDRR